MAIPIASATSSPVVQSSDKVASSVVVGIEPALQVAETARSASRSTNDLTAYDLYLRGYAMSLSSAKQIPEALCLMELACAIDNAGGWYRGTGRSSRRQQVRRRSRGLGLIFLLHAFFEGLDPLGEIAHHAGQLAGTEQNDDNGQDYDPMHQTERTHRTNSEW
jgi:hypothetical protein